MQEKPLGSLKTTQSGVYKKFNHFCFDTYLPESFTLEQAENFRTLSDAVPEMYKTLKKVNQYFVDLQNRCGLTPGDEKVWAEVSKILNA